jgi:hypothetical protein
MTGVFNRIMVKVCGEKNLPQFIGYLAFMGVITIGFVVLIPLLIPLCLIGLIGFYILERLVP